MNIIEVLIDRITGKAPKGAKRSSKWRKVRKEFITEYRKCEICETKKSLEIHHKVPFHLAPDLELNKKNLITLCRKHHLLFGHLNQWSDFNFDVELDAKIWYYKLNK